MLDHLLDAAAVPPAFYFWEDFLRLDGVVDLGAFDFTAITTGTIATNAANGGWARLSGAATTDDSGAQIQAQGAHAVTDGKFICFKARCQINESTSTNGATESDLLLGLFVVDTSIVASLPTDGIYFVKADGGTSWQAIVRVAGAAVSTLTLANVADKSFHTYGIGVWPNGSNSTVEFSIDGVVVGRATGISLPASSVFLTPSIAFQSGDATGTKFCDVDYVGSAQLR